ncbi:MAG: cytochrome c oxidase accessory protein CcoG [Opitutaceae bacterium]|jgi:cytochrome c oxidase accessory protein FixG|nr:cytochrome c oxidase accessory protein CcoG [Opitutaceae bacterium]
MCAAPKVVRPNRDSVTTIRDDGSRLFLHPADARGFWTRTRRWSAWFLVAIYLSLPWIPIGGHPAVFLDIADRRFHLFGYTLAFQDIWLLFFAITGLGFSLFFLTSLLGRVWCGWACPQTVFLEHVYRRIERWIEGDAVARRKLDAAPWTAPKIVRRGGKQILFLLVSAVITHLFLAYFVSVPELWAMMHDAPAKHWSAFLFVAAATGILYFNFAWFREQLCLIICPYGRLQSVLLDDHSLVIGYDAKRGEPRGKVGTPDAGACIDCNRCVQVCPTGIDIRQGLQIECISCAACVDACDEVMDKVQRPRGLVRYDSTAAFGGGRTRWLRPRIWLYLGLLGVGATVATFAVSSVRPAVLGVTRLQGAPYYLEPEGVRNQFLVRLVNKRDVPATFTVRVVTDAPAGATLLQASLEESLTLAPLAEEVRPLVLRVPRASYEGGFKLRIVARAEGGEFELVREAEFSGPDARLLKEDKR